MTDSTTPSVFFHGVMPFGLKPNRAYRVYVLPLELVFIYAGSGENFSAAIGVHFGALGALVAAALDPSKKNRERQEQLDGSSSDVSSAESRRSGAVHSRRQGKSAALPEVSRGYGTGRRGAAGCAHQEGRR